MAPPSTSPTRSPYPPATRCGASTDFFTPHVADTLEMAQPLLARRVGENVRRYLRRQLLLGVVDPAVGY